MRKQYPFNSGLVFGKAQEIYRLCKIVSDAFLCVGLYESATEQGIVNYLYYNICYGNVIILPHYSLAIPVCAYPEDASQ